MVDFHKTKYDLLKNVATNKDELITKIIADLSRLD